MEWTDNRTENEKRLEAKCAELEAENKALKEAARERVDSGHSEGCLYRSSGPCFCGHDALAALLEE